MKKLLCLFTVLSIFLLAVNACSSGGKSSNSSTNSGFVPGTLVISPFMESKIMVGESTNVIVSLTGSSNVTTPVAVNIINNNKSLVALTPASCQLTTESNNCVVNLAGLSAGSATFSIDATGYESATSQPLLITSVGIVIGNVQGLVFKNTTPLLGTNESTLTILDGGGAIATMALDVYGNLYAGTNVNSLFGGQVWKNTGGNSYWVRMGNGYVKDAYTNLNAIAVDHNGINIYAAMSNGTVYKYNSTTNNWNQLGSGTLDGSSSVDSIALDQGGNVYAGTSNGKVYEYTNNNWVQLGSGIDSTAIVSIVIHNNQVYAATEEGGNPQGQVYVYNSGDWEQIGHRNRGQNTTSMAINNNGIYVGTSDGSVFESLFSGGGWVQLGGNTINGSAVNAIALDPAGNIYAGTQNIPNASAGQVYKFEAGTWSQVGNLKVNYLNYPSYYFVMDNICPVKSLVISLSGVIYSGSGGNNTCYNGPQGVIYHYLVTSNSWISSGNGSLDGTQINAVTKDSHGNLYAGTSVANVFEYSELSKSWIITGNLPLASALANPISTMAVDNNGVIYATLVGGSVWIPDNTNINGWVELQNLCLLLPVPSGGCGNITSVSDDQGNVYFAVADANPSLPGYVWKYNNLTGLFIQFIGNGINSSVDGSSPIALALDKENNLYVGTHSGSVFRYNMNSATWTELGLGVIDGSQINSIVIDTIGDVYVGTENSNVFKFAVGASYWQQIGNNSLNSDISDQLKSIALDSSGNLYAATYKGHVWKYPRGGTYWGAD